MPISSKTFSGRRSADNAISDHFGKYWCSTHSPTKEISEISKHFLADAEENGYIFNTNIIETYPHPAILTLIPSLDKRLPYKVGKRNKYWPQEKPEKRRDNLYENLQKLRNALAEIILLPNDYNVEKESSFVKLKSFEDTLDALVCAWVGIKFMNQQCERFGDKFSSIWIPRKDK